MSNAFPAPPAKFVGREDYVARFKARLEHFRFFLYEGISGIGKTSLLLRLAKETRAAGMAHALYMPVFPGEGVSSILARLECRLQGGGRVNLDQQGDPYARLVDLLDTRRIVLVLDALQNLRREDLPALVRIFYRAKTGHYRVLGGIRGDPGFSAMDRAQLHLERVGALTAAEVTELAAHFKVDGEPLALLQADAARGGAVGQPLTCRYLLALCGNHMPPKEFLDSQSARSVHAFKAFMPLFLPHIVPNDVAVLAGLARLGMPVAKEAAVAAWGSAAEHVLRRGLADIIDGDIYVHHLVSQCFTDATAVQGDAAQALAAHLQGRAMQLGEPLAAIRAAEVLAHAGFTETAVDSLASSWEWARDPGFREAYLKALATVPVSAGMAGRLRLLAAQARMRQGNPLSVLPEIEKLSLDPDPWTRSRALSTLAFIQSEMRAHAKVIEAYAGLRKLTSAPQEILPTGIHAVDAMVQLERLQDAEALAHELLASTSESPAQEGELRRLLAYIYAYTARLQDAVAQARQAAECFNKVGDLYHMGTALGFIGDLYREAGEFASAREAFAEFLQAATRWGDRNLIQIAELADAWVSLDVGDVAHAAKKIAAVQKDLPAAPSRRLKRYLAAAEALLEAGRGHHDKAAELLAQVVETWDAAGQRTLAGGLKAQLIRSLIACDRLDAAAEIVTRSVQALAGRADSPHLASLLRESALLNLRRGNPDKAMQELAQARAIFAAGGNRREEALTLHRIAHAALDEGNVELAAQKAAEAYELANRIKHARAKALVCELQARLGLLQDDAESAVTCARESLQSLRRLGDELGTLHVSETLLRAYLYAGDLASALSLGPKLRDLASRLEVTEVRVRAIAYTGIALLRRDRVDVAKRCFRELSSKELTPWTCALMGRFGEALALTLGDQAAATKRRSHWLSALRLLPPRRRAVAIHALQQLAMAPRDRCELREGDGQRLLGTEELGLLEPNAYQLFVDILYKRICDDGEPVQLAPPLAKLTMRLALAYPAPLPYVQVLSTLGRPTEEAEAGLPEAKIRALVKEVQRGLQPAPHVSVEAQPQGLRLMPPDRFAILLPVWLTGRLTDSQKHILKLLRKLGSAAMHTIQDQCKLSRSAARRDMGQLTKTHLVEAVREGRGQVYRLA